MTDADGTPPRELEIWPDADDVAEALAARLTARLAELQTAGRVPQVCLTGGRIATRAYARLAADDADSGAGVDWGRVELWWGDERFVPADDGDRNDLGALSALGRLGLSDERLHRMPASDAGLSLDEAAAAYADELGDVRFDICLLGLGPDGHVASLFPDHPSSQASGRVIAVRDSPKPPPERVSLTLEVINASDEVWFLVSGEDKADAARLAQTGGPVPGAHAHGTEVTLWLMDEPAASRLPTP